MDRKTTHRENLVQAAVSSPVIPLPLAESRQRIEQVLEALRDGKESQAAIARRFGISANYVSELYVTRIRGAKPPDPDKDPAVVAAEEALADAQRRGEQMRLLALSALHDAKARDYLRQAQALDR